MVPIKTKDPISDRNFQAASQEIDAIKLRLDEAENQIKSLLTSIKRIGVKL